MGEVDDEAMSRMRSPGAADQRSVLPINSLPSGLASLAAMIASTSAECVGWHSRMDLMEGRRNLRGALACLGNLGIKRSEQGADAAGGAFHMVMHQFVRCLRIAPG